MNWQVGYVHGTVNHYPTRERALHRTTNAITAPRFAQMSTPLRTRERTSGARYGGSPTTGRHHARQRRSCGPSPPRSATRLTAARRLITSEITIKVQIGRKGRCRTRTRSASMTTTAPESRSAATASKLAANSPASSAARRCPCRRNSTTDGEDAFVLASNSPKSVSPDTTTLLSSAADAKISLSDARLIPRSRTWTAS